jgi:hypothetical protein
MRRINFRLLIGTICVGLFLILLKSFILKSPSHDKSLGINEEVMRKLASDLNKNCPFMVDKETRFDNAMPLPDNTFQYNYTLINWVKDSLNLNNLYKGLEPGIVNGTKTSPGLQIFRDEKVTLVYQISDKNGVFLFKIVVTPDMYLK